MALPEHFLTYMKDVAALPESAQDWVAAAYEEAMPLTHESLDDLIVGDYFEGGERRIEEVWFFTDRYAVLVPFLKLSPGYAHVYVFPMEGRVTGMEVTATDYPLAGGLPADAQPGRWVSTSSLVLNFGLAGGGSGIVRAVRGNCDALYSVVTKYFQRWL